MSFDAQSLFNLLPAIHRIRDAELAKAAGLPRGPLEELIGTEALERYEAALEELSETDRELVVARMEFDGSYEELAELTGKPSANACRMAVKRALMRLAKVMAESEQGDAGDGATQVLR